jgi:hypothetical protein
MALTVAEDRDPASGDRHGAASTATILTARCVSTPLIRLDQSVVIGWLHVVVGVCVVGWRRRKTGVRTGKGYLQFGGGKVGVVQRAAAGQELL